MPSEQTAYRLFKDALQSLKVSVALFITGSIAFFLFRTDSNDWFRGGSIALFSVGVALLAIHAIFASGAVLKLVSRRFRGSYSVDRLDEQQLFYLRICLMLDRRYFICRVGEIVRVPWAENLRQRGLAERRYVMNVGDVLELEKGFFAYCKSNLRNIDKRFKDTARKEMRDIVDRQMSTQADEYEAGIWLGLPNT